MRTVRNLVLSIAFSSLLAGCAVSDAEEDPYLWLEEVEGEDALAWVEARNAESLDVLQSEPVYQDVFQRALEIYDSEDRIPAPELRGGYVYNLLQDAEHTRGIWRRTSPESYEADSPEWETVLDLDLLSETEGEDWVWKGAQCLPPDAHRCLLNLSRGGADAVVRREFDTVTRDFVSGGFDFPESKGGADWVDENTLLVGVDFGEGSMTTSGYPRMVKRISRGESLAEATLLHEIQDDHMGLWPFAMYDGEQIYNGYSDAENFYSSTMYLVWDGETREVPIPKDASVNGIVQGQMIIELKSDWTTGGETYEEGSLLSASVADVLSGDTAFEVVWRPEPRRALASVQLTRTSLVVTELRNVRSELFRYRRVSGRWVGTAVDAPTIGSIYPRPTSTSDDRFYFTYTGFLTPSSLYVVDEAGSRVIKNEPEFFDTTGLTVVQLEATSVDGTSIPYFVVHREDLPLDGSNPTLLYAYGGFEISLRPSYSAIDGAAWLEQGGVYVLANLRGGGEFGPSWHQAGLKENRQRIYDDFAAVAEDLIERGITSSRRLGIFGGSNGGLLTGVALTQRPDLYEAVISAVPLLDMKRYNKLLAGASWMAEYGNPDIPEEWDYISQYSPYQNVDPDADYPEVFLTTSTRDDRVHPGHARKMTARLMEQGHPVLYWENTQGGHAGAINNEQRAMQAALRFAYLNRRLVGGDR